MYNLYLRVVVELVGDGEDVIGLRADRTGPIGVVNFNITYIKLSLSIPSNDFSNLNFLRFAQAPMS